MAKKVTISIDEFNSLRSIFDKNNDKTDGKKPEPKKLDVNFKKINPNIIYGGANPNVINPNDTSGKKTNTKKSKIVGNVCLEEKGKIKIYKYPKEKNNSLLGGPRIILFLGDAQESFINTFINFYRCIEFKDEFRHKIIIDLNDNNSNYLISSYEKESNKIKIISIPFCKEKDKSYIKLLPEISKMTISRVFYTFHKDVNNLTLEQKREIEYYKYLLHFLGLRDKLIFLCDSKEELKSEELNEFLKRFNIEENDNLYEGKTFSDKIFFFNNEIIYENNDNSEIEK